MTGKSVHLSDITVLVDGFGKKIVGSKVVASVDDDAVQVSLLPSHPVQRLDVGADRDHRDECFIGVGQELAPGALDWQGLALTGVARQSPILNQSTACEHL